MRNLVWIGAILFIIGAASAGIHEVDRSVPAPAVAEAGLAGGPALPLSASLGVLLIGLGLVAAGGRSIYRA